MELKFLFGVQYFDGTEYYQTPEDTPTTCEKGSAFTDVMARIDEVRIFQLASMDTQNRYVVDMLDGHFEVNGLPFFAQIPPPGALLRLVYFRRRREHMTTGPDGRRIDAWSSPCQYHFGWQCTHEGKNFQQTIILI